mgnify:CR=1 FL=1
MCSGAAVERKTSVLRRPESSRTGWRRGGGGGQRDADTCWERARTHPAVDLFNLAQEAERLNDRLGDLDVLWRVFLDRKSVG